MKHPRRPVKTGNKRRKGPSPTELKRGFDLWRAALLFCRTMLQDPETLKKVEGMIRARDVESLCALGEVKVAEYSSDQWTELLILRQLAAFFKKNESLSKHSVCQANAVKSFLRAERICSITNKRLAYYDEHEDRLNPELLYQVRRMRQDIAHLVGEVHEWERSYYSLLKITSGATEDRPREQSYPFLKITGKLRATRGTIPYLGSILLNWGVDLQSVRYVETNTNRVVFVPKKWSIYRTIAAEAKHTLPFQLSVDTHLKRKLKEKWRIDLQDQTRNQRMALRGSIDGSIATVDVEMASDTNAYNTVYYLFPYSWASLFDRFRASRAIVPWLPQDETLEYSKFSSMGNGYTFAVETIIFAAACRAVGSKLYSVYGDDIAIESELVVPLIKLLKYLGFSVNESKSFADPTFPFRESCGCDYLRGAFVTPFYVRRIPKMKHVSDVAHLVNGLVACSAPGPLWDWLADVVKRYSIRVVPRNYSSTSGVWITPHAAWRSGILRMRAFNPKRPELPSGMPVFNGYRSASRLRRTDGWRSLFLWYISRCSEDVLSVSQRHLDKYASMFLQNGDDLYSHGGAVPETATSATAVGVRHIHSLCVFDPKPMTPSYLFLWDLVLGDKLSLRGLATETAS